MPVCQFYLRGQCKFGNSCRNEHPADVRQSGFGNSSWNNNRPSNNNAPGSSSVKAELPYTAQTIQTDLDPKSEKPLWPLSCYAPYKSETTLVGGLDMSPEELRFRAVEAVKKGGIGEYTQFEANQIAAADQAYQNARSNTDQALEQARKQTRLLSNGNPNPSFTAGPSTGSSVFGAPTSAFGAPTSVFGGGTSAFGSSSTPSVFGSGGAFGSTSGATPSAFGSTNSSNPFGSTGTNPFGSTSTTTSSAFGSNTTTTPSAFGSATTATPSAFSSNTNTNTTTNAFGKPSFGQPAFGQSAFGQPSTSASNPTSTSNPTTNAFGGGSSTTSAFGQPTATTTTSAFGQPTNPANTSSSSVVKPATSGAFGAFAGNGASAFGAGASPAPAANAVASGSTIGGSGGGFSAFAGAQPTAFGSTNTTGAGTGSGSVFGQPSFGQLSAFGGLGGSTGTSVFGGGTFGGPAPAPAFGNSPLNPPTNTNPLNSNPSMNPPVVSAFAPLAGSTTQPTTTTLNVPGGMMPSTSISMASANSGGAGGSGTGSTFGGGSGTGSVFGSTGAFGGGTNAFSASLFGGAAASGGSGFAGFGGSEGFGSNTHAPSTQSVSTSTSANQPLDAVFTALFARLSTGPSNSPLYKPNSTPYDSQLPAKYIEMLPKRVGDAFRREKFVWGWAAGGDDKDKAAEGEKGVPEWVPPVDVR